MRFWSRVTALAFPPKRGSAGFAAWNRLTALNVWLYRRTRGRLGGRFDGAPVLLLHHVGRKTGQRRVNPLLYMPDGENMVIVASWGGAPHHPAWFLNLKANPETEVEVRGRRIPVRAEVASPEERKRLWPRLVDLYPGYANYQARTEREIPLVILRRLPPPSRDQ